jgi:hypothetical protein
MHGELILIERLEVENAELRRDIEEAQKGYRWPTWGGVLSVRGFIARTSG